MKLIIEIDSDNDSFTGDIPAEVVRTLRDLADKIDATYELSQPIMDINGNRIGESRVERN